MILPGRRRSRSREPCGSEFTLERLTTKPLFEQAEIIAIDVNDATELALIGETQIETVGELDRQALEAKWRLLMGDRAQPAGHPQVDDDGGVVVKLDNQVLGAAADTAHRASFDPRQDVFDAGTGEDTGKIGDPQRADPLTDDLVDQGAPDGFDLGEFWHTRTTVVRLVRCG